MLSGRLLVFLVIPDISNRESRFSPLSLHPFHCHFDPWEKSLVRHWGEISRFARNDIQWLCKVAPSFSVSGMGFRVGRGGASVPNRPLGEGCLSPSTRPVLSLSKGSGWTPRVPELSYSVWRRRDPEGCAQARMVLGPFAETKGSRRVGTTPHIIIILERALLRTYLCLAFVVAFGFTSSILRKTNHESRTMPLVP